MGGEPERSESSGEQKVPTRAKDLGSKKGHGFPGGRKPLEHRGKVVMVLPGSAGAEGGLERVRRSPGRRKALKSEAQERWGLKEASQDEGTSPARREGSQTLG